MQVGALIAFLSYLIQILMSVMMATFVAMLTPRASVSADRIEEVLDAKSSVVPPADPVTRLDERSSLELRDVEFKYPGADYPVLCDISFKAVAGETTAIIGSTGAGKTTLLNLVPRLFDATGGAVLVDGYDVRDIEPELLWSRIGLVPQKPYLFSGHRGQQPALRQPRRHRRRALGTRSRSRRPGSFVVGDARRARGTDRARRLERLRRPAPAARHRPGARAPARHLPLRRLVLGARPRDRRAPARRARARVADAVTVIVAQRVSTIINADQILVIEDGRQVGLGTHHELLETCPTYAEIVASQLTEEEAA